MDGPIDAQWVEDMNTVFDDNRTLCLASAERIHLGPGQRIVFETDTLCHASPTTVSRCGVVYLCEQPHTQYLETWLATRVPSLCKGNEVARETLVHAVPVACALGRTSRTNMGSNFSLVDHKITACANVRSGTPRRAKREPAWRIAKSR